MVNTPASYLGGPGFESLPRGLTILRVFMVFVPHLIWAMSLSVLIFPIFQFAVILPCIPVHLKTIIK
jgi:hypothetical protein